MSALTDMAITMVSLHEDLELHALLDQLVAVEEELGKCRDLVEWLLLLSRRKALEDAVAARTI